MPASLTDPSLLKLLRHYQPADVTAGCFLPQPGLSDNTLKIMLPSATLIARQQPRVAMPFVNRCREYRLLKKLAASGAVAGPLACNKHWLLLAWQPGEPVDAQHFSQHSREVCETLSALHHQPLTGYPVRVTTLLERYWQLCQHRSQRWLQSWQRLLSRGEPAPLRLAPVHMDIHAGNVLFDGQGCRFIDWEYAADGDIALDLTVICLNDPPHEAEWISTYARIARLDTLLLARQVARWKPWLKLLMACWYQLRAEQTASPQMQQLARHSWQHL